MSLLTDSGDTKDDLKLPTDDALLKQVSLFRSLYSIYISGLVLLAMLNSSTTCCRY